MFLSSSEIKDVCCRANAERMLGSEGWKPTAKEAVEAGLITEVVTHDQVKSDSLIFHLCLCNILFPFSVSFMLCTCK